jgi:Fic family protein
MNELLTAIAEKKALLDALRPVTQAALLALQKAYDVDLTYSSNAIEGNTLTLRETAELIEHGITVGGKPLRDHLEAVDHYEAVLWMRDLATKATAVDETIVRELHRRIVARSQPEIGGVYSTLPPETMKHGRTFRTHRGSTRLFAYFPLPAHQGSFGAEPTA